MLTLNLYILLELFFVLQKHAGSHIKPAVLIVCTTDTLKLVMKKVHSMNVWNLTQQTLPPMYGLTIFALL